MRDEDRRLLVEALAFTLAAHGDQKRNGSEIPYASHPLAVASLVFEAGGDAAQAAAALLHDTIEDGEGVDESRLRAEFGADVAAIVAACSEVLPGDTRERKEWGERKKRYLARATSSTICARWSPICAATARPRSSGSPRVPNRRAGTTSRRTTCCATRCRPGSSATSTC